MSKKFEYIKRAAFFSEQKPEMLASLLEGVIEDVETSVSVSGDSTVEIPTGDTANTATYSASVLSQFGDEISGKTITFSIPTTTGVTIGESTGVLSVSKTATAGVVTITATAGSLTGTFSVTLKSAE